MFNLEKVQEKKDQLSLEELLLKELRALKIYPDSKKCEIDLGDERVVLDSIHECHNHLKHAIEELKDHLWESWKDLGHLSEIVHENNAGNSGGVDNLLFLNAVKNSFLLSRKFTDLEEVTHDVEQLFHIDASLVHEELISKFNLKYLEVRILHYLIMHEIYRSHVISSYLKTSKQKTAQVSGPWSNLDLPMQERAWEWTEDEEYQENRTKARREQTRYNPEYDKQGFFFVWQDFSRDPYRFEDFQKDSPYKSRGQVTIP